MKKRQYPDSVKIDDTTYSVKCLECETVFEAIRSDAAYCSSTCRGRAFRRERNREAQAAQAIRAVQKMLEAMPGRGESIEFTACNEIIRRISKALNNVET